MKKTFSMLGIVFSALLLLLGLLTLSGGLVDGSAKEASSAPYSYDSGYASFGADFYTYVSNNAEEAAAAGRATAYNLTLIFRLIKTAGGSLMMCLGAMGACFFGLKYADVKAETAVPAAADVRGPVSVGSPQSEEAASAEAAPEQEETLEQKTPPEQESESGGKEEKQTLP